MKNDYSNLQVECLHKEFDNLQYVYGDKELNSIYGAGCILNPNVMFVFMNPTKRNVASVKSWKGLRAQWLGTKNIWKLFYKANLINENMYCEIIKLKPNEWTYSFSLNLYQYLANNKIYITNLGKCTQKDARPLANTVFQKYLSLLESEIEYVNPKVIFVFGNQVSSIILNKKISVSKDRGKCYLKKIKEKEYKIYPLYYPVGQGMRNLEFAVEDIKRIMKENML